MSGAATNTVAAGPGQLERGALVDLERQRRRLGRHELALAERPARRAAALPPAPAAMARPPAAAGSAPAPAPAAATAVGAWTNCGAGPDGVTAAAGARLADAEVGQRSAHDRRARRNGGDGRRQQTLRRTWFRPAWLRPLAVGRQPPAWPPAAPPWRATNVIARTAWAARSDSRRLRSSETLSVGVCRDAAFLAGAGGLGLAGTLVGVAHLDLRQHQRRLEGEGKRRGERQRRADAAPGRRFGRQGE